MICTCIKTDLDCLIIDISVGIVLIVELGAFYLVYMYCIYSNDIESVDGMSIMIRLVIIVLIK